MSSRWLLRALRAALTGLLLAGGWPHASAQGGELAPFETVRGRLDAGTLQADWHFEGAADQVVSLIAVTDGGDLDPVLQVIGPDGAVVGENDDIDALVRDAGLEALRLPASGTYTARVLRQGGGEGTTVGGYALTLTPGFARTWLRAGFEQGDQSWVTAAGEPLALAQGWLRLRAEQPGQIVEAFPPGAPTARNVYFAADARQFGTATYAEAGLVIRAQGPDLAWGYRFKVNAEGAYSIEAQDGAGVYALRSWTPHPALAGESWRLAVLARDTTFAFYANDVLLDTVQDTRLPGEGTVGLLAASRAGQDEAVTVLFDDAAATVRLGSTYAGLPLVLTQWQSNDPAVIMQELVEAAHLTAARSRAIYLPERPMFLRGHGARFELIGTEQAVWADFVLEARVQILVPEQDVGCGLVFRWQDERNLELAYLDTHGGFGLVEARDAQLSVNTYDISPMVQPAALNRMLVLAQGDQVALYLNGALVAQETMQPAGGRAGGALLNYSDLQADCYLSNVWAWEIASE